MQSRMESVSPHKRRFVGLTALTLSCRRAFTCDRQCGATAAATTEILAGAICGCRDAVVLALTKRLGRRASIRRAVGCSVKLAGGRHA